MQSVSRYDPLQTYVTAGIIGVSGEYGSTGITNYADLYAQKLNPVSPKHPIGFDQVSASDVRARAWRCFAPSVCLHPEPQKNPNSQSSKPFLTRLRGAERTR